MANRPPGLTRNDLTILAHPIRYARWRRDVARKGPYAPAWDGPTPLLIPVVILLMSTGAFAAVVAIIVFASN